MAKAKLWMLAMVACIVLVSCRDSIGTADSEVADYTMLIYGTAGGRMDNLIEAVWEETQLLLPDKKVRVFCLYKYGKDSEDFAGKYGAPGELMVFELTKDTRLEDLTSQQDGVFHDFPLYEPACLTAALDLLKTEAPAKDYVLTLFGHGGGFDVTVDYPKEWVSDDTEGEAQAAATRGVIYDEWMVSRKGMNMYQLTEAIGKSEIGHLKGLVFHNCLMGGVEMPSARPSWSRSPSTCIRTLRCPAIRSPSSCTTKTPTKSRLRGQTSPSVMYMSIPTSTYSQNGAPGSKPTSISRQATPVAKSDEYYIVTPRTYFVPTILVCGCSLLRRLTTVTTACARLMKARPVAVSLLKAAGVPASPLSQML